MGRQEGARRGAAEILKRLPEGVAASVAFAVDDLSGGLAFDTEPTLPPDTLAGLTAREMGNAERVPQSVGERGADATEQVASDQKLYAMEMDESLTLALLLGLTEASLGNVYVKVRRLRQGLASALNRHCP